jgi:hypothetical protein
VWDIRERLILYGRLLRTTLKTVRNVGSFITEYIMRLLYTVQHVVLSTLACWNRMGSSRDEYCSLHRGPPQALAWEETRSEVQLAGGACWCCGYCCCGGCEGAAIPEACKNPLQGWEKNRSRVSAWLLQMSLGRYGNQLKTRTVRLQADRRGGWRLV